MVMMSIRETRYTIINIMIYATKIKLKPGRIYPHSALEISTIYLVGVQNERFYAKEVVYDLVKQAWRRLFSRNSGVSRTRLTLGTSDQTTSPVLSHRS